MGGCRAGGKRGIDSGAMAVEKAGVMPKHPPTRPAPTARMDPRIWLLAVGSFAIGTDAFVVAGILPQLASGLGVSLAAAGQVATAYALTYGLGSPVLAALVGRMAREKLVLRVLAGFAVANIACALAPSYGALLVARVAAGVAAALYTPTAYVLAATLAPPTRRGAALAVVSLGLTAAAVLGVPAGVWLGQHAGWHAAFWMVAGLTALAWLALTLGRLPATPAGPVLGLLARLAPLTRRPVLLAILPQLLWSIGTFTVYTYVVPVLLALGQTPARIPWLLLAFGAGGLIGSQFGGRLADRFGPLKPIVLLLCLALVSMLALSAGGLGGSWRHVGVVALDLFIWPLASWGMWTPQQSRLVACAPQSAAVLLATANSVVYLSQAMGAAFGALLLPAMAPWHLPLVGAGLYLTALLVLAIIAAWPARAPAGPQPGG